MRLNKENKEVLALVIGENEYYYSNSSKLGEAINLPASTVNYYVREARKIKKMGDSVYIKIVDGSNIPFGEINKYRL